MGPEKTGKLYKWKPEGRSIFEALGSLLVQRK